MLADSQAVMLQVQQRSCYNQNESVLEWKISKKHVDEVGSGFRDNTLPSESLFFTMIREMYY